EKIKKVAKAAGIKVIYYVLIAYYLLKKPEVPKKEKAIIIGALGYFIMPLDLVPDFTAGVGYVDDLGALALALGKVALYIDDEIKQKAKDKLRDIFGDYDDSELEEPDEDDE
ncbi:MAG: DUF1232 domain-containing protein, partial [Tissierellales bacterium]|nr:DUF1232 domain-containing protein [Tissierellales bacterium]